MGEKINEHSISVGKPERKKLSGRRGLYRRILLKWNLEK
jgi:hypothetical protein